MAQMIITSAFETLKAEFESKNKPLVLDEFVLANVPEQDENTPIDRAETLPPENQIVFTGAVSQSGFVSPNAVIYSLIMDTGIGDFSFNWIGLRNKAQGTLAAISHIPLLNKIKSVPGVKNGNAVTRSLMMSYVGAKAATGITVDASTWQIDFTARLMGIDETERLANTDHYGQGSFLGDGYQIFKSGGAYSAKAGIGYVGGLRCVAETQIAINHIANNMDIYIDASWQGGLTSEWQTVVDINVSETVLTSYVDSTGLMHYVAKLAEIDNAGNVIDCRIVGDINSRIAAAHAATAQAKADSAYKLAETKITKVQGDSYYLGKTSKAVSAVLADKATILATTRTINGVGFNGATNITVYDATKVPTSRKVNGKALTADVVVTKADVGLQLINNWSASSATNHDSTTTYATAAGVKAAYDRGTAGISHATAAEHKADSAYKLADTKITNRVNDAFYIASDGIAHLFFTRKAGSEKGLIYSTPEGDMGVRVSGKFTILTNNTAHSYSMDSGTFTCNNIKAASVVSGDIGQFKSICNVGHAALGPDGNTSGSIWDNGWLSLWIDKHTFNDKRLGGINHRVRGWTNTGSNGGGNYLECTIDNIAIGLYYFTSDARFKKDIKPTKKNDVLSLIDQIDFREFVWNESAIKESRGAKVGLGIIAQEVERIIPEFVSTLGKDDDSIETKYMNTTVMLTYALKAIQELSEKVKYLESKIK